MANDQKATPIQQHQTLHQMAWEDIDEPGAYVDVATGDLYRIPQEGLLKGASPLIRKESATKSSLVQLSKNPFALALEVRMICAENNIQANF